MPTTKLNAESEIGRFSSSGMVVFAAFAEAGGRGDQAQYVRPPIGPAHQVTTTDHVTVARGSTEMPCRTSAHRSRSVSGEISPRSPGSRWPRSRRRIGASGVPRTTSRHLSPAAKPAATVSVPTATGTPIIVMSRPAASDNPVISAANETIAHGSDMSTEAESRRRRPIRSDAGPAMG